MPYLAENERQIQKRLAWFRHVAEVTHNVRKTCRYFGISHGIYYFWYWRYQKAGESGLKTRRKGPPKGEGRAATSFEIVEKVIYLRKNYHYGPTKIRMYLERYHGIKINAVTAYRILKRMGMNRLPLNMRYVRREQRFKRYEKPLPGDQIQIDVKFIAPIKGHQGRYYQYSAIDDCTRLRVLKIYDRITQQNSIAFVDLVLSRLPFPVKCIQTDNGQEFQQQFHWHVLDKGVQHRYIRVKRPYLNGKVERSHRIDGEEFYRQLKGVTMHGSEEFNRRLKEWEDFYNYARLHGALDGKTPYERLRERLGIESHVSTAP